MKKIIYAFRIFVMLLMGAVFVGCSNDDGKGTSSDAQLIVAFEHPSINFSSPDSLKKEVRIVFSEEAPQEGTIEIIPTLNNLVYGEENDFVTIPPVDQGGALVLPVEQGQKSASFQVEKKDPRPTGEERSIVFDIVSTQPDNWSTQGNTTVKVTFSDEASLGGSIQPEVGGPNEPNQVYVTLSSGETKAVKRDSWDLGFYNGAAFRVKLNSSLKMFAGSTEQYDIDAVGEEDVQDLKEKMHLLTTGSANYIDDPSGLLTGTAIQEIEPDDENNPVYLVNLGNAIGTQTPEVGSVAVDEGDSREGVDGLRGYKKIRILRDGDNYILQYADVGDTTHKEVEIPKNSAGNFNFYSLLEERAVEVEPEHWDMNFTTHTESLDISGSGFGDGLAAYGFSDFVVTNVVGGVETAKIDSSEGDYNSFSYADLSAVELSGDTQVIADQWRDVFNHAAADGVFFVLKDQQNNFYKIKFTALVNEDGVRGYPAFEYALLK